MYLHLECNKHVVNAKPSLVVHNILLAYVSQVRCNACRVGRNDQNELIT